MRSIAVGDSATVQVMDVLVSDAGHLLTGILTDVTVRAAIFADLAFAGAVSADLLFDPSPTGFEPADRLLAAALHDPTRSLSWWLRHGPVNTRDVAKYLVGEQLWERSAHSLLHPAGAWKPDTRSGTRSEAIAALRSGLGHRLATPQTRCAAVLVGCAGWLGGSDQRAAAAARRCGDAAWLVRQCVPVVVAQRNAVAISDRLARAVPPNPGASYW